MPETVKVRSINKAAFDKQTREMLELTQSSQDPIDRRMGRTIFPVAKIVPPPYSPELLFTLYDNDPDFQAGADTIVSNVCEVGVQIKHISALSPTDPTIDVDADQKSPESLEQYARLKSFLDAPNKEFDFKTTVAAMLKDAIVGGTGFLEFGREATTQQFINQMWYARAIVTRVSADPDLLYQIQGTDVKPFRRFESDKEVAVIQQVEVQGKKSSRSKKKTESATIDLVLELKEKKSGQDPDAYVEGVKSVGAIESSDLTLNLANDTVEVRSLTEIMQFMAVPDHSNSYYGRPIILGAIGELMGAKKARDWNLKFFDNNTVPPLCIVIKGSEMGQDSIAFVAENIGKHSGADQQHKLMIMQLDDDTTATFEKLGDERLDEGSFLALRDQSTSKILASMRVPESLLYSSGGQGTETKEQARRFLETVVKPYQERLETLFNRIFREQMGITEWGIKFESVSAEALSERVTTWDMLMRRGVMTINEVRVEIGLTPMKGGDQAFITIPGTGTVLVEFLELFAQRAMDGKSRSDINPAGGSQTPAKGINPIFQTIADDEVLRNAFVELLLHLRQGDVSGKEVSVTEVAGVEQLMEVVDAY